MMKVLVIGAGISGLTAAWQGVQCGFDVEVVEATGRTGGLMRSEVADGAVYDIGAFEFFTNHPMLHVFPGLAGLMEKRFRPLRSENILSETCRDAYPFSIRGLLRNSGPADLAAIAAGYLLTYRPQKIRDFREWVIAQTGKAFYEKSGLHNYIERFFCMPDRDVSLKFAAERMKYIAHFRAGYLVKQWVANACRKRPVKPDAAPKVHSYLRPVGGFTEMFAAIEALITGRGGRILKNERIMTLAKDGERFCAATDKRSGTRYDMVVLAAPPYTLAAAMGVSAPENKVETFGLVSLFLKGELGTGADICYNSTRFGAWKRLTAFNRLYRTGDTPDRFTVECIVDASAGESAVEEKYDDFIRSARRMGLIAGEAGYCGAAYTPDAYPRLTTLQEPAIARHRALLDRYGITGIGRQGEYRYCGSHECVADAVDRMNGLKADTAALSRTV